MVARAYVPDGGDLVWLTFDPRAGHEQPRRTSGPILSPRDYNSKARLAIACPISSHVKGYPFEVRLPEGQIPGEHQALDDAAERRQATVTVG